MVRAAYSIFVFGLLSLVFCLFTAPVLAQSENLSAITPSPIVQTNPNTTPNTNPDVPKNLHNWTQNVMLEVMLALTCQLVGIDPTQPNGQCLGVDQQTGKIGFLPAGNIEKGEIGGAIGGMNNMIAMLYTPPIQTGDYFQYLAQNFGIVKSASAQTRGTGFDGLVPLLELWKAFRDIAYLIFVLVFIVIGLAIMLRIKIDPRTVMSIQNQIPKIIIGILLVTFSFAIAGFLIDLMWIMIYLIFGLISGISTDIAASITNLNPAILQGKSPLGIGFSEVTGWIWEVSNGSKTAMFNLLGMPNELRENIDSLQKVTWKGFLSNPLGAATLLLDTIKDRFFPGFFSFKSVANWFIHIASGAVGMLMFLKILALDSPSGGVQALTFGVELDPGYFANIVPAIFFGSSFFAVTESLLRTVLPFLIIYVIIFIAVLTALFRLWFALLMAYINILIDVVLAPFWIVGSLVPGSPISAVGWLRDLIANLAAFPTVIAMFLLGKVFVVAFRESALRGEDPFAPPLIGDLGGGATGLIGPVIGIGVILMTPNVVTMVKAALKAPKFDTSTAGKMLAAGAAAPGRLGKFGLSSATHEKNQYGMEVYKKGSLGIFGRIMGT